MCLLTPTLVLKQGSLPAVRWSVIRSPYRRASALALRRPGTLLCSHILSRPLHYQWGWQSGRMAFISQGCHLLHACGLNRAFLTPTDSSSSPFLAPFITIPSSSPHIHTYGWMSQRRFPPDPPSQIAEFCVSEEVTPCHHLYTLLSGLLWFYSF